MKRLILAMIMAFTFVACTKESPMYPVLDNHVQVSLQSWLSAGAEVSYLYYFTTAVYTHPTRLTPSAAAAYNNIQPGTVAPVVTLYVPKADYDEYF